MRLAWFSPMPPARTGVATVSAELVSALAAEHEIDVFVDEPVARATRLRSAHEFVWRHGQKPYDLTVYQLGNSSHHDYLWPYLFRYPGLVILHDARLHHARAAALLRERRADDYRAEFAACEPDVSADAAELAVAGFDSYLYYEWPFTRLVVRASRAIGVHSRAIRDQLTNEVPDAAIEHIRLAHGTPIAAADGPARAARARARHGIPADAVVFGCFGGLTPEKRIPQILDAFDAVLPYSPSARLLLAGSPAAHYDVAADVARRRLDGAVVMTGYIESDEDLTDAIAASDVTLNLRWPTAREMSGPWLRCLAAGKASIILDLAHTGDSPTLDPRTWTASSADEAAPIAIAIDVMDEDHSLRLAMRRLAGDPALAGAIGAAARAYWQAEHAHTAMLSDYRRIIARAVRTPSPAASLPPHLRADESGLMTSILDGFGLAAPWGKI